jgi:hypothetical protein
MAEVVTKPELAMTTGLVAFLDVLGFSSLVSGDTNNKRLQVYLQCLQRALDSNIDGPKVEYVVFSDSIVLTTPNDSEDSLKAILRDCSRTLGFMLQEDIPLRGAIAHGPFCRESVPGGVFVAGKSIIEAYRFEKEQDWVGIMLAPSIVRQFPNLAERCSIEAYNRAENRLREIVEHLAWSAFLQNARVPFHSKHHSDDPSFDGFAIVPIAGDADPRGIWESVDRSMTKLERLKSFAPDPPAQAKYKRTIDFLRPVRDIWREIGQLVKLPKYSDLFDSANF